MTTQDDSYPSQWFGPRKPAADDWRADDAAMRQELAGYSRDDLELLADLRFMFKDDCPPETRARSTTRLRVAQEMLDEMASHDDKPEDGGHPPHLFYPSRVPRREIDWEKVDMRWMAGRSDNETRLYRFFVGVSDFLSRLKRRQHKAQVNRLADDAEPSSCASSYQPGNVTIACSIRTDTDGTTGSKSFRDRLRD